MDLVDINLSDFPITCPVNSKVCSEFNINGTIFAKMGQYANLAKLNIQTIASIRYIGSLLGGIYILMMCFVVHTYITSTWSVAYLVV